MRGLGSRLTRLGVDATCYTYPGQEIPYIRGRVQHIFSAAYQPRHIVVQCGGNDSESHPPQEVIKQYSKLIDEIRAVCPDSTITINRIPIRGKNQQTLINIAKINTYIGNRGKRSDRVVCGNFCPDNRRHFKRDLVHFNEEGSDLFARNMSTYLRNFRHRLQKP